MFCSVKGKEYERRREMLADTERDKEEREKGGAYIGGKGQRILSILSRFISFDSNIPSKSLL